MPAAFGAIAVLLMILIFAVIMTIREQGRHLQEMHRIHARLDKQQDHLDLREQEMHQFRSELDSLELALIDYQKRQAKETGFVTCPMCEKDVRQRDMADYLCKWCRNQ